jgi:CheY-like chemotaxis protein
LYNTLKVTIPEDKNIDFYLIKNSVKLKRDILTDEVKLKQVIVNLLTNAIKFTENGHVFFGFSVDQDKQLLEFKVEDTGLGISEKDLRIIFDRFRRIEEDYSISLSGLGLGLSISKAYVEMLGGEIGVTSVYGKGSIFTFTIPLVYDESSKEKIVSSDDNLDVDFERKTILVAEDDNINYLLLKTILERKKHIVLRARNGQEAVDISVSNSAIDLVFMDIKMPVLDGYEAFEIIKKHRPQLFVIAQTAHSSSEVKERIIQVGFSGFITKPLDKEKIYDVINKVFQNDSIY